MKKLLRETCSILATCVFLLSVMVSCTVDNRYDFSKEIDTTIGVGKGLKLPLGSTQKFFISELIDTAAIDVLKFDDAGNLVIYSGDSFASDSFKIDDITLEVSSQEDVKYYDFKVTPYQGSDIPVEGMPEGRMLYIVHDTIDIETELKINETDLPKEVKRLTKLTFKDPVELTFNVEMSSKLQTSRNLLKTTDKLNIEGDYSKAAADDYSEKYFEVDLPDSFVFDEKTPFENGILMLNGVARYNYEKEAICYKKSYYLKAIDLTKTEKGYIEIVNGCIDLKEMITAHGVVKSDPVLFEVDDVDGINNVEIKSILEIGEMKLDAVEGCFEPEIEPVSEVVDLDLGNDLDFLKNAYLDFTDPRLAITFNNGIGANILADARLVGYDEYYNELKNTCIDLSVEAKANDTTKILIDRYGNQIPGWTNCVAPNLNELIKKIPDHLGVDLNVRFDNTKISRITLGEYMAVGGSYELQVPLAFDSLGIKYTYSIEDVFGKNTEELDEVEDDEDSNRAKASNYNGAESEENSENTSLDVVKEIRGVSLSFTVLNTVPVALKPQIFIYDEDGYALDDITLEIEGEIKRGNEVLLDGVVGEPVESEVKVRLSAQNTDLNDLYRIDIRLVATGKGAINSNEYIQLADIALSIDDYIVLDLNN